MLTACKYYFFSFSLELVNGSLVSVIRERVNGVEAYPILVFFLKATWLYANKYKMSLPPLSLL